MEKFDIAQLMQQELQNNSSSDDFLSAVDHLNAAAEALDDLGLHKEAELTTKFLEVLAKKKKKTKSKSKTKSRTKSKSKTKSVDLKEKEIMDRDPAMNGLTPEKMLDNLAHKGWVFNADDMNDDFDPGYVMDRFDADRCDVDRVKPVYEDNHLDADDDLDELLFKIEFGE
jgi:hypothetical protein